MTVSGKSDEHGYKKAKRSKAGPPDIKKTDREMDKLMGEVQKKYDEKDKPGC